jgi:hypothetical protein
MEDISRTSVIPDRAGFELQRDFVFPEMERIFGISEQREQRDQCAAAQEAKIVRQSRRGDVVLRAAQRLTEWREARDKIQEDLLNRAGPEVDIPDPDFDVGKAAENDEEDDDEPVDEDVNPEVIGEEMPLQIPELRPGIALRMMELAEASKKKNKLEPELMNI